MFLVMGYNLSQYHEIDWDKITQSIFILKNIDIFIRIYVVGGIR